MRVPWIRVHAVLIDRPVTMRLAQAARISPHEAAGVLVTFWGAVASQVTNGAVGGCPDAMLEAWARWRRKRGQFAAWVRAEHLDADGRIREWDEYAGKLETIRERDRTRKKPEFQRNSSGIPAESLRNSTPARANGTERGRNEDGTVRDANIPADDSARDFRRDLVVQANASITARWGEQTRPIHHDGKAHEVADRLKHLSIPFDFAAQSIARQVAAKPDDPPRNLKYFLPGILDDWQSAEARREARDVTPATALAGRAEPDTFLGRLRAGSADAPA